MTAETAPLFTTSRTFDAPRDLVWRVWTEQAHLGRWMSPAGMTQLGSSLDLRPGGVFHYGLRTPDGLEMWGKWVFRRVVPPELLEFVQSFSDAAGGLGRNPMAADWPLETLSTVAFSEADGKTTVTLSSGPINASERERQMFAGAFGGMTQGWGGTFDKLEAYLAEVG
ncbi:SRPBCC family protein [Deinococcus sp.]|uniref:SRPBCC family protein n=1 Tax=Deinococcus sp. TaxID=47478 RepID=UPI003C7BCA45